MRSHTCLPSIFLALGFLSTLLTNASAYPVIYQYNEELQDPQTGYELSSGNEQPNLRVDPSSFIYQTDDANSNQFYPQFGSMMPLDEPSNYMHVIENDKTPSQDNLLNGVHSLMVDRAKKDIGSGKSLNRAYHGGRSKNEDDEHDNIDPVFLNAIYSTLLQKERSLEEQLNHTDRNNTARDGEGKIDPSFLNQIRVMISNIMQKEFPNVKINSTAYMRDLKSLTSNSSMYQMPPLEYNSGYIYHPMPLSMIQTIPEVNFGDSMFYNGNPNVYSQQYTLPTYAVPPKQLPYLETQPVPFPSKPTQTLPPKPSEASQPPKPAVSHPVAPSNPVGSLPASGSPPMIFGAPGQDSLYLQPMYPAPVPMNQGMFQYWSVPYSDANGLLSAGQSVDWGNSNNHQMTGGAQTVDTKPSESNLTRYDNIDPVTEKKGKAHFTTRGEGKDRRINSNTQYTRRSSKNAVRARPVADYDDLPLEVSQELPQKNIPMMKRVLVPSRKNAVRARSVPDYDDLPLEVSQELPQKNIPLLKKVLVPLSRRENRISSNRIMQREDEEDDKPRYKVLYHLQKTYVPI